MKKPIEICRKSQYDAKKTPLLAKKYAKMGLTHKEIAEKLEISLNSYFTYVKKYPEFAKAVGKR